MFLEHLALACMTAMLILSEFAFTALIAQHAYGESEGWVTCFFVEEISFDPSQAQVDQMRFFLK